MCFNTVRKLCVLLVPVTNIFIVCICVCRMRAQVCVWKDVRSVNSQEYQELQSLFEDSHLKLKQVCQLSRVSICKKCCRSIISH